MVGKTLGHYEILEPLGQGGMGEVYRARDTKLDRDVAIKVLPEDFAKDADRLARFEREAKLLASLNHANIAAIYGLEDDGETRFIAMELVEGETLAQRIARAGQIDVEQALEISRQIAEALEAAHDNGVIHRDLKPANVIVTTDRKAKVLDFGLAKVYESDGATADVSSDLSHSPTIVAATQTGVILGTAAYMSPEQARGKVIDKRSDIWAFGCVLYELLSGVQAFRGETASDTMAAILKEEPDEDLLPADTPKLVALLLRRCLRKDPRRRLRDIGDARLEIDDLLRDPQWIFADGEQSAALRTLVSVPVLATILVAVLVAFSAGVWLGNPSRSTSPPALALTDPVSVRTTIDLPPDARLGFGTAPLGFDSPLIAISPNGAHLAYIGRRGSETLVYLRSMDSFEDPRPVEGSQGAFYAFFDPDSDWLGFLTTDAVMKVSLREGDRPQIVSPAANPTRAAWVPDDVIYFAHREGTSLSRVAASGGPSVEVDRLNRDLNLLRFSQVLPDGRSALISGGPGINRDYGNIYVLDLDTLERTLVVERGYDAHFAPSGHLLFARGGTLHAVSFDPVTRRAHGSPIPVMPEVDMESLFGQAHVTFSETGTLVYIPGGDAAVGTIASVNRETGETENLGLPEQVYGYFELSPDDRRIAAQVGDVNDYILIWDLETSTGRRLSGSEDGGWPRWSSDGSDIVFSSRRSGSGTEILRRPLDPGGTIETILGSDRRVTPESWHPDGDVLTVQSFQDGTRIGVLRLGSEDVDWIPSNHRLGMPHFSRDGRWIVHSSDETGRYQIWVRSYPDGDRILQLSTTGGIEPNFCRACDELFYRFGNRWFAYKVTLGETFEVGPPEPVFETDFIDTPGRSYDVSADGQQLLVVKTTRERTGTRLNVVLNWFEELKRLVPTDGSR